MSESRRSPKSVRREILFSTAMLFAGALAVAVGAAVVTLPLLDSPAQAALFITLLIAADLAIVFWFVHSLVGRWVFDPLGRIGAHAEEIAGGGRTSTAFRWRTGRSWTAS